MADTADTATEQKSLASKLVFVLSIALVVICLINAMPGIPGLDQWAQDLAGNDKFIIRKFPFEYYYPFAFAVMMLIVALIIGLPNALALAIIALPMWKCLPGTGPGWKMQSPG